MEGGQEDLDHQADFVNRLPPGYRFHPTDDEIINYYLTEKIMNPSFVARAIAEVDLNKCEPWDLPEKAKMGEKEWYFFCQRDRKYPTGMRTNRATEAGYWKATGKDREIFHEYRSSSSSSRHGNGLLGSSVNIGMKKTLVFYQGRAPKGTKTNWVMHEYRLDTKSSSHHFSPHNRNHPNKHEEWVVCRVFFKRSPLITKSSYYTSNYQAEEDDHKVHFNDVMVDFSTLPPLLNPAAEIPNMFIIDSPPAPPSMDNNILFNQHRITPDDSLLQDTQNSSGLTIHLSQLATVKKESIPWYYHNMNYDHDPSIDQVGTTLSDSELDNLWN